MNHIERLARLALLVAAAIAAVAFFVVAVTRIGYPYELDWLESGVLDHVRRLADGQSIYVAPGIDFVPFPYPPVFPVVSTALAEVIGADFTSVRLVSVAATLGTAFVLHGMVKRETSDSTAGMVAAGIYLASFGVVGGWFDVGKPDSLFLFLTLAATWLLRVAVDTSSARRAGLAGLLFALAILTKQTAVLALVPVVGFAVLFRAWKPAVICAVSAFATTGVATALLDWDSNGWFRYFVWQQLGEHSRSEMPASEFFTHDLRPYALVLLALALVAPRVKAATNRWPTGFYASLALGLIAGAFVSRLHDGGFLNVLMPAVAAMALAAGLAAGWARSSRHSAVRVGVPVCALLTFGMLVYSPAEHIPTRSDRNEGLALIASVRAIDGPVLVLSHPTYGVMAGKAPTAHWGGAVDTFRATDEEVKRQLEQSYVEALESGHFKAVVVDTDPLPFLQTALERCYSKSSAALPPLTPIEGFESRPTAIWTLRPGGCV